jgi:phage tail sheath protein FI
MRIANRITLFLSLVVFAASISALAAGDAASSPQAKAYAALQKTVAAGDYEGFKKAHTKATAKMIDQQTKEMKMDAKKMMEFMKEAAPKDLKYTAVKVDGKKATLEATGKVGGEQNKGTISLEEEDGQWKVVTESWTNAK